MGLGEGQMGEHEPCIGKSDDWLTPKPIFDALPIDEFDLDPAHPGRDNPHCVVPARKIFTRADDGLRQPRHGLAWLNPPFGGRRGQVPWLRKFFAHGNGIALVAARTSADWFHDVVPNAEPAFSQRQDQISLPRWLDRKEIANTALERPGLGFFVRLRGTP